MKHISKYDLQNQLLPQEDSRDGCLSYKFDDIHCAPLVGLDNKGQRRSVKCNQRRNGA